LGRIKRIDRIFFTSGYAVKFSPKELLYWFKKMKETLMEPTKNDSKRFVNSNIKESSSSEVGTLLNKLRKTGIVAILNMNKKSQMTMSSWAHDIVNQYNAVLKNNPMKLKNITELPCSKMDAKLAIKFLLLGSVEKGLGDHAASNLRDKFISLGSFQSIDQKDIVKLMNYIRDIKKKSVDANIFSLPGFNKYMDLIISEQKALLEEINSFIEDIRKIKKNSEL
jgi:hypothetical protein